jgi:hypothetical protein
VDPRGVEPRTPPCHGGILPLYYGPYFQMPSRGIGPLSIPPARLATRSVAGAVGRAYPQLLKLDEPILNGKFDRSACPPSAGRGGIPPPRPFLPPRPRFGWRIFRPRSGHIKYNILYSNFEYCNCEYIMIVYE